MEGSLREVASLSIPWSMSRDLLDWRAGAIHPRHGPLAHNHTLICETPGNCLY